MAERSDLFDGVQLEELRRRRSQKWSKYPQDVIPAWVAEMDFPVAEPVRRAVIQAAQRDDFGYPPDAARTGLDRIVVEWAERSFGWTIHPGDVVIVPDVVKAIEVALKAFTQPGDGVVIQPPVYPPFHAVVPHAQRRLIENPLASGPDGRYEIDLDHLDLVLAGARALLLCNPQNPTGRCLEPAELQAIAALCIKHDILVVADEVHAPLTYSDRNHGVFAMLGEEVAERTITVTAASKAWNFGGLKCGFMVGGSPRLTARLQGLSWLERGGASILGQEATAAALAESDGWMADVVDYLDGNRRFLHDLLSASGLPIGYSVPEATYLAWLDLRAMGIEDPYEFFLTQAKVALSNGRDFGRQGAGFVRLNFATSRALLEQLVRRMLGALDARG